jgi:hypothetical protein
MRLFMMFSVVVMLSTIVGAMVTGIGTPAQPPTVHVAVNFDDESAGPGDGHDELTLVHHTGDAISGQSGAVHDGRVAIMSTVPFEDETDPATSGCECTKHGSETYVAPLDANPDDGFPGSTMRVGSGATLYTAEPGQDFNDATVQLVWRSGNGDSAVLLTWKGPSIRD